MARYAITNRSGKRFQPGGIHVRIDATAATADLEPGRLCRDLACGDRDRLARSPRRHAPVQLRAGGGARQTRRQCACGARCRRGRPRRDAGLEFVAAPRTLLRRDLLRPRAAHGQSAAVRRATGLHHQPRRKRLRLFSIPISPRWSSSSRPICRWYVAGSRCAKKRTCRPSRSAISCATRRC